MTTLHIPDEIANLYADRARAAGYDPETFMRQALIAQLEDLEDVEIAMERLSDPQPTISLEQLARELGLDD